MLELVQDAHQAYERYREMLDDDRLVQGKWRAEQDGRDIACAMGVAGIDRAGECPSRVMPRWLAQMVPYFFDRQAFDDAKPWGLTFWAQLDRLDGKVPFSVLYDWQANLICASHIKRREDAGKDPANAKALQALHLRAFAGEKIDRDTWHAALKAAYRDAYANVDAFANAFAYGWQIAVKRQADGMVECLARVVL